MTPDNYTLVQRSAPAERAHRLREQGISPLLAALYAARGIETASQVTTQLADLLPIGTLKNAGAMGSILADCAVTQERVLIVSDYDCDGATAGSVLIRAFEGARLNFGYLVPDRIKHGYGLTPSIVDEAAALQPKPKFIITVDNGISSHAGVERAREHGIEVLVTDHHLCPEVLPKARLIVNPNQPGCRFESKHIAGCGVAWYVASAMHNEMQHRGVTPGFDPRELLPYVAVGTVADVVQLDRNNRILVRAGLDRIRRGECAPGILALAAVAKRNPQTLSCTDVGFAVGPRINAAGRMAHMSSGIECLTTQDQARAQTLASALDAINTTRRELQKTMVDEAAIKALATLDRIEEGDAVKAMSVVVYGADWHEGVVGIVAGRLKDERHRPTFVLCDSQDGNIKGSGRSIDGFHLKHALDKINIRHPGVLVKFGGHAMAAGITISADRLDEFKAAFEQVCREEITPDMLELKIEHDGDLPLQHLNADDIRQLELQVWGQGFPPPVFVDDFPVLGSRAMGTERDHLRLVVAKDNARFDVIAFGEGHRHGHLPRAVQVVYQPSLNEWNGMVSVQMMAQRLLPAPALEAEIRSREADAKAANPAAVRPEPAPAVEHAPSAARFGAMIATQRRQDSTAPPPVATPSAARQPAPPSERRGGFPRFRRP